MNPRQLKNPTSHRLIDHPLIHQLDGAAQNQVVFKHQGISRLVDSPLIHRQVVIAQDPAVLEYQGFRRLFWIGLNQQVNGNQMIGNQMNRQHPGRRRDK